MSRGDRLRNAGFSALPLLLVLVVYGVLAASGAVPVGVMPALAMAVAAQVAITYVRTAAREGRRGPAIRRGRGAP